MTKLEQAQHAAARLYFMIRELAQARVAPKEFVVDWALDMLTDTNLPIEIYGDAFLDHKRMTGVENENSTD